MKIPGIYKIQSKKKPERIYIGSAVDIKKRWRAHSNLLKNNQHHSIKLQRHVNKYGFDDLYFQLLCGCDNNNLIENEQFYIDLLKPWFNILPKAGSSLNIRYSAEYKEKMSKRLKGVNTWSKGQKMSEEAKRNMGIARKGHPGWNKGKKGLCKHTDEFKRNLSNRMKGRPKSKESVLKMSLNRKGKLMGKDNPNYGRPRSEEVKQKIRETKLRNRLKQAS